MSTKYNILIQCLPECEKHESGWQNIYDVHTSDLAEAITILKGYSKIKDHKVTLFIDEEFDD